MRAMIQSRSQSHNAPIMLSSLLPARSSSTAVNLESDSSTYTTLGLLICKSVLGELWPSSSVKARDGGRAMVGSQPDCIARMKKMNE